MRGLLLRLLLQLLHQRLLKATTDLLDILGSGDAIKAFKLTNGTFSLGPTSLSAQVYPYPGASFVISANGANNGILWTIQRNESTPGILRAYDAANLNSVLYASNEQGSRDSMGIAAKFSTPVVANGKVFVAGAAQLTAYGFLP